MRVADDTEQKLESRTEKLCFYLRKVTGEERVIKRGTRGGGEGVPDDKFHREYQDVSERSKTAGIISIHISIRIRDSQELHSGARARAADIIVDVLL